MIKLLIHFFFISLILALGVWSCVDVPSSGELPPNYKSTVRFIHVATDAGAGRVAVDGVPKSESLNFGQASQYFNDILAGGRLLKFGTDTSGQNVTFVSNGQHTVLVVARFGDRRFLNLNEGYNFRNNAPTGVAQVRFVNAAQGSSSISFRDSSVLGRELTVSAFLSESGYTNVTPGNHTIYAISNIGDTATFSGAFTTGRRYLIVATGNASSFQMTRFTERQFGLTKVEAVKGE